MPVEYQIFQIKQTATLESCVQLLTTTGQATAINPVVQYKQYQNPDKLQRQPRVAANPIQRFFCL